MLAAAQACFQLLQWAIIGMVFLWYVFLCTVPKNQLPSNFSQILQHILAFAGCSTMNANAPLVPLIPQK